MIWINLSILVINILVLIFGYQLVKKRIEKKVVNKQILSDIKKEMNGLIMNLNETTLSNVSIIEEKVENLKKLLQLADKKIHGLSESIEEFSQLSQPPKPKTEPLSNTYTLEKVVNQSRKVSEIKNREKEEKKEWEKSLREEIKELSSNDKIKHLNEKGLSSDEIRKIIQMDKGEFELLLNLENIQLD
ncbi:MAG: hypothetical protein MJB14_05845 [Spirochaetes bacterium]|nr:hypothetical protein [Spirochaetota bacterium]